MAKSLLNKASLLFFLLLPGGFVIPLEGVQMNPEGCEGIELKIEVRNSSDASHRGSVEAIVAGAEKPIYYIFYKEPGKLLSMEFTSAKVDNIEPGTYYCSIQDGKGCVKKIEFKIE